MKEPIEYRICIECLEKKVPKSNPQWKSVCIGCYIKKKQIPLDKCLIQIKKT